MSVFPGGVGPPPSSPGNETCSITLGCLCGGPVEFLGGLPSPYFVCIPPRLQYSPLGSQFRGFILESGVRDRGEAGDHSCR